MAQWRETFLSDATKVTALDQPLRAGEIIGGDLRNMRDEDLGDIEDVVIGASGEIRYVIVSTGGFIGFGEEEVPVPWSDLKVTAAPYRDTFVLDVSKEAFSDAPRVDDSLRSQLATGERNDEVEGFWDDALGEAS
ncbi:PRC-barrel domain-containing protein [Pelagibius sp. 7325]|uniref:PRC-barrel domain-containing protein n=1 Tax=Pelagibius sp. 7325 TaxID=3131994 RepID=UPI0030EF2571